MSHRSPKAPDFMRGLYLAGLLMLAYTVQAASGAAFTLADIRHEWAHIKYQLPVAQREAAYARLHGLAREMRMAHPADASMWLWEAIILANEAGEKHSLASVQMIRQAKSLLEKALSISPNAGDGLACAFLGNLYHSMPGWPVGFGDNARAEYYLRKALAIAPGSLDTNYFMGSFLLDRKHLIDAAAYLKKALDAPPRPGMDVADAGRKADAARKLTRITHKSP